MKIDRYFEADSRSSQWPRATGRTKNPLLNTYRSSQRTRMGRFGSALDIKKAPDRRQSLHLLICISGWLMDDGAYFIFVSWRPGKKVI